MIAPVFLDPRRQTPPIALFNRYSGNREILITLRFQSLPLSSSEQFRKEFRYHLPKTSIAL